MAWSTWLCWVSLSLMVRVPFTMLMLLLLFVLLPLPLLWWLLSSLSMMGARAWFGRSWLYCLSLSSTVVVVVVAGGMGGCLLTTPKSSVGVCRHSIWTWLGDNGMYDC